MTRYALFAIMVLALAAAVFAGYDAWGYNDQANMFNGYYCDSYQNAAWCQQYKDVRLIMKWNDAWIDENNVRHEGHDSYIGSDAWLTNHMSGTDNGKKWTYFVKIKAMDYAGQPCSQPIWGEFCVVEEVNSGLGMTFKDMQYGPGFGN
jgi:hypothetical protein